MKHVISPFLIIGVLLLWLSGCSSQNSYRIIGLNEKSRLDYVVNDFHTPDSVALHVLGMSPELGSHTSVQSKKLCGKRDRVTIIEDRLSDDSVQAKKSVVFLIKDRHHWKVLEIRESWKCWEGRGHRDWSSENCI